MTTTTQTTHDLSNDSINLFRRFWVEARDWEGAPPVEISKEERGNLTQLKRADLVYTDAEEDVTWLNFTPDGVKYAASLGLREKNW